MSERPDFPKMEEEVLEFWKKQDIFKKTLEKPAPRGNFVFFEGPPTANGKPGIHHVEARAYKDVIPRYKTMRGFRVERKAGWDTHGLPVEIEVEKKLGISGKPQIESLRSTPRESVAHFNELCKKSVWTYLDDWVKLTERIGFWLDLERPYITYQNEYIESLWWIVKQINDRGLLYKDYKVVPYCSRCGTPLSSHELAQGYDEAEDPSVFVKFKVSKVAKVSKVSKESSETSDTFATSDTFFLVWTTTPWTLPANVALAVGAEVEYVKVRTENREKRTEFLILAKARLGVLEGEYEIVEEYKGKDLLGWEYEPLYSFVPLAEKAHYVVPADFVSTEDGTGIVHTAVMYGVEDFELGKKIGLPKQHLVDLRGEFIPEVKPWAGLFVKKADPLIIEELKSRGLMYRAEKITHTYPFCWRCKTPILYYAKDSWYVKMSALRDDLIRANGSVNWVPDYIKEGRFGEWLREVKDWAFSRERFWGTPLPVWICDDCGEKKVVGGFADFSPCRSGNTYYILRHGDANTNLTKVVSADVYAEHHVTEKGKEEVREAIAKIKKLGGVDLIIASPVLRTKETAEMVADALGLKVDYEERLREINFGVYEGRTVEEYESFVPKHIDRFDRAPERAETLTQVFRRMFETWKDLETKYKGKKILIVSHGDPLWIFEAALRGLSPEGMIAFGETQYIKRGELRKLDPRELPRNQDGFVDPHKPYIDDVTFNCEKCSGVMRRTPEVCDVWFDSGSMPFAQSHYPFEAPEKIDRGEAYPADYICEAIDQTRGWFYTLLAVATLLKKKSSYKNVICLGHLLDKKGKKMSKSLGNVVDPWEMINKYGADAVRWYMYSVNQPGDPKLFDESDLDGIVKRQFMILWNVLAFWKLYALEKTTPYTLPPTPSHTMDQWIIARLNVLTKTVTEKLDAYDLTAASRAIADFINDLSTWYVRRSRDRFKDGSAEAVGTLGYVLETLAKLMAPFTPFLAEKLFGEVFPSLDGRGEGRVDSVHLEEWPRSEKVDQKLLDEMEVIRHATELGHAIRAEKGFKVRQPLAFVEISEKTKIRNELLTVLADELNVKEARVVKKNEEGEGFAVRTDGDLSVALDLRLTPELKREGWLREIIRQINDLRKESKLTIQDRVTVFYDTKDAELEKVFIDFSADIQKGALATAVKSGRTEIGKELTIDGIIIWISVIRE